MAILEETYRQNKAENYVHVNGKQNRVLKINCFWCEVVDGTIKLLEAEDAKWLTKDTLYDVQWLPADITLISKIEKMMGLVKERFFYYKMR